MCPECIFTIVQGIAAAPAGVLVACVLATIRQRPTILSMGQSQGGNDGTSDNHVTR